MNHRTLHMNDGTTVHIPAEHVRFTKMVCLNCERTLGGAQAGKTRDRIRRYAARGRIPVWPFCRGECQVEFFKLIR